MEDWPQVAARLIQYVGAMPLVGVPLFYLFVARGAAGGRGLLAGSAVAVIAGALLSLAALTASMMGDWSAAVDPAALASVMLDMGAGRGLTARLVLAAASLAALAFVPRPIGRTGWVVLAGLGSAVAASFAWTGHGSATEGLGGMVHLLADILHLIAAGAWFGALLPLGWLVAQADHDGGIARAADALTRFAGLGSVAVAVLTATGLVNSWFMVGLAEVPALPDTLYGQLLLIKLAAFGVMLALAAGNRWRLTPKLVRGTDPAAALGRLRVSLAVETMCGFLVLAAVAALGTLAPPAT